jgi:hypothetical protein
MLVVLGYWLACRLLHAKLFFRLALWTRRKVRTIPPSTHPRLNEFVSITPSHPQHPPHRGGGVVVVLFQSNIMLGCEKDNQRRLLIGST